MRVEGVKLSFLAVFALLLFSGISFLLEVVQGRKQFRAHGILELSALEEGFSHKVSNPSMVLCDSFQQELFACPGSDTMAFLGVH